MGNILHLSKIVMIVGNYSLMKNRLACAPRASHLKSCNKTNIDTMSKEMQVLCHSSLSTHDFKLLAVIPE